MALWNWLLTGWRWFLTLLHIPTRNRAIVPSTLSSAADETSLESGLEKLRREIDCVGVYDLHNILRRRNRIEWCEWHLNIDQNNNAIKIAKKFHKNFGELKLSPTIVDNVEIIEEMFLKFMPHNNDWNEIRNHFKKARQQDNLLPIIKAYTLSQQLSSRINKHSAANTYHALKLYCTLLNCPILAQTQEYTDAITKIFFHPKLNDYLVRKETVYRGIVLEDKKLVANYKEGVTIITTTFLSTSTNREVADCFSTIPSGDMISVFCIYNINNTYRRTALDLRKISSFEHEQEILILRYVPFTIKLVERTDDDRRMTICFDECKE